MVQHLSVNFNDSWNEHHLDHLHSKFFTFVVTMNGIGLLLAILDGTHRTPPPYPLTESPLPVWHYPRKYTGALVLGNLFTAVMMRNELFGRLLYLIVNTCFAKVCKKNIDFCIQSPRLRRQLVISGHRCGSGSVAHPLYNILEESTLDARPRVSRG